MAVQTSFNRNLTRFIEGAVTQDRLNAQIQSKNVAEAAGMAFGRVGFLGDTDGLDLRLPHSTQATYVTSGANPDFVTSNSISVDVVVNGVTTNVSTTFNTNHLTTITALAGLISAVAGVGTATVGGTGNRTITVPADPDTDVYLTNSSVTGGATQPDVTLANSDAGLEYGPTAYNEEMPTNAGVVLVDEGAEIGAARSAYVALRSDADLIPGQQVYVRFIEGAGADQKRGMVTDAAGASSDPTEAQASTTLEVSLAVLAGELGEFRINK